MLYFTATGYCLCAKHLEQGQVPGAVIRFRSAGSDPDGSAAADRWYRSAEIPPVQALPRRIEDRPPV